MVDFNVGVVIVAAGLGTRLGGSIPKQYYKILVSKSNLDNVVLY